jgi:LemA protein
MPLPVIVALAAGVIISLWVAVSHNALVRLRNHCTESWADIDTELKRRYDLIPNLVSTVRGYATHERDVLERVTSARAAALANHGSPASQAVDENTLAGGLRQLVAVAERYPELKANHSYLELQRELAHTEDRIQRARRFYNANVRDYNTRIEVIPSNVIASMFRFQKAEFFEAAESGTAGSPPPLAINDS